MASSSQIKRTSRTPKASSPTKVNLSNMMKMNQWVDKIQTISNSTKASTACNIQNEKIVSRYNSSPSKTSKSIRNKKEDRTKRAIKVIAPICSVDLFMDVNVNAISVKTQMNIQCWEAFKNRRPV